MTGDGSAYLETASGIGARLARDAAWAGDRCSWIGATMEPGESGWVVAQRALGPDLYSGTAGIALFMARLHEATGERIFRAYAAGALRHALGRLDSIPEMIRRSFFSGAPGIAWVAAACGTAGVGDGLVDRGLGIMLDSTRGEPAESEELDVVSGTAATIVAWLDFHARYDEPALLEAAVMAGDRIIAKAQREPAGVSWTLGSMPTSHNLTGFGHGASGYAWALLELYAATGENRFRDTALDAFRYERACYDAERENWPDYRESDEQPGAEPGFTVAWCHGAAGIGLVRVRAAQLLGDGQLRAEADAALRTVSRSWQEAAGGSNYSLCHGAAGNADLALLAGHVFDDDDARALATAIGDSGIDRYERARMVWPGGVTGGGESPTLMLGSAGTGYFYLRLFDPTLPSVLLLRPH